MKKLLSVLLLLALALPLLVGCGNSRDYQPDVTVTLAGDYGELIIREWTDGDANGAEVYHKAGKEETLLGETSGTADGSFPFSKSDFSLEQSGKQVVLRWNAGNGSWKTKTFMVP